LQVDPSKDAAICEFCGTPFIVEKAIALCSAEGAVSAQALLAKAMQFLRLGEKYNFERFAYQALDIDPLYIPARWALVEHAGWDEGLVKGTYKYYEGDRGGRLSKEVSARNIKDRFERLIQLCQLDPEHKEHYIKVMACKEVPPLIEYYERMRNEKVFIHRLKKGWQKPGDAIGPPFAGGFEAVTEENLPGIANIFRRELVAELERLHPQLFELVKEMFH